MGQKLSKPDLALYRAVDEVLHYVWDPIGVSLQPEARDEYHGYLPQVFRLLREGADESKIAAYLTSVTTERMGLSERTMTLRWLVCYLDLPPSDVHFLG